MGAPGGLSPGGSIAIGIIVGLLSTSVQSLGLTLQRKSHILEDEKEPHDPRRPPHRRRRWQIGMGMFVVANVLGSSIQISTLPLPVLSALQAAGLVFNSICASLILSEPFTKWSLWGTVLVSSGAILIGIFGAIPSPAHSLRELLYLMGRWQFILWMALQAVLVVSIAVVTDVVAHIFNNLAQTARFRFIRGLSYGCISGILSAHSLLFAKSAVELILRTIADGDNQFVHWQSWMIVLGLVTLALTQLYFLHRGLKLVSTSVLYPLVFCIYNIIAILDGLIYFDQMSLISPLSGGLIAVGTVILLSGVLALSWRLNDDQHQPAVGQSTLAPGLGLVEDTDGEEDSLIEFDPVNDDDEDATIPAANGIFTGSAEGRDQSPISPVSRKPSMRWRERADILGELEDQAGDLPPNPRRSATLPVGEAAPLLGTGSSKRHISNQSTTSFGSAGPANSDAASGSRVTRRRRKSTGFPGFTARKTARRKSGSGVGDVFGGLWRAKWFKGREQENSSEAAVESPTTTTGHGRNGSTNRFQPYRDEEEGAGSSRFPPYRDEEDAPGEQQAPEERGADTAPAPGAGDGDDVRGSAPKRGDDAV